MVEGTEGEETRKPRWGRHTGREKGHAHQGPDAAARDDARQQVLLVQGLEDTEMEDAQPPAPAQQQRRAPKRGPRAHKELSLFLT